MRGPIQRSLLWAGAFGLWWALWGFVLDLSTRIAWPGSVAIPLPINLPIIGLADVQYGPRVWLPLALLAASLPPVWALLERALRLDPRDLAFQRLIWGLKASIRPGFLYLATLAILTAAAATLEGPFLWVLAVAFVALTLLCVLIAPLAVLRPRVLRGSGALRDWRPRWVNLELALAVLGLVLLAVVLDDTAFLLFPSIHRSDFLEPSWFWRLAGSAAWSALSLVIATGLYFSATALLVFRTAPRAALSRLPELLRWRYVGPWLAQNARLVFASLWFVPPAVSYWLWDWQIMPGHTFQPREGAFPYLAVMLISGGNVIGRFWWVGALALAPALSVLAYLYRGRLVWLLGEQEGAVLGGVPSPR
jgi:hypothetical protein